ncbi:ribosomal protein L22e [Histoplasma mississippiense (nom. inval.)]|uniref:60S ribosomal protein L22 n=1 Tax=Ajellomyces capsulatus (strain NAm1 / WU24) TaxID=2059318 RepID=UPI000157C484|nr:60S ribosomal protein L22 [Histoplasma mississippiense (nom. inval.)]EDN08488.1 ribosomal protein L22e [Histoplasma mississippiense (nom. inval.)]
MAPQSSRKSQKVTKKYVINCSQPVNDKIFDVSAFEKFLHDRVKVEGRVGNLGDSVEISQTGDGKIEVVTHIPFSGRYLKYLTKKFLKKQQLRDWLRVVLHLPRVSMSCASTTSSTTRRRRMRIRFEKNLIIIRNNPEVNKEK